MKNYLKKATIFLAAVFLFPSLMSYAESSDTVSPPTVTTSLGGNLSPESEKNTFVLEFASDRGTQTPSFNFATGVTYQQSMVYSFNAGSVKFVLTSCTANPSPQVFYVTLQKKNTLGVFSDVSPANIHCDSNVLGGSYTWQNISSGDYRFIITRNSGTGTLSGQLTITN